MLASGDLVSRRYVRGRGRGGHRARGFPLHGRRRVAGVGRLRADDLVGVLPHGGGVLLRDSGRVPGLCRRGQSVPGRGESSGHGPLVLSCHGPYPYPHDHLVRGRDGLGERSDDVPSHRGGGENGL